MANIMFDQFKALLVQLINDPDVRRKNYVLQDDSYRADLQARIESLSPDVGLTLDWSNALTPSLGMLSKDSRARAIKFNPKGFANYLSAFREGTTGRPTRFFKLPDNDISGARYLLADQTSGVFLINESMEVVYRFPNYGPLVTLTEYNDPSAVTVFTIGATRYLAVALYSHHIVQIYSFDPPYTHVSTIGVIDTPGDIAGYCNNPRGVTADGVTGRLYILNEHGTPPGATLDRGYLATYDVTVPATPVHVESRWYYGTTGSLLDTQLLYANDCFFDPTTNLLWITNGNNEVGAFDMTTTPPHLAKFIEPSGDGYTFRGPKQITTYTQLGGYSRIYVANSATGSIEEFDHVTLQHLNTYGYRASEDELSSYNRLSDAVYGALGAPEGVVADRVYLDGQYAEVLIASDLLNKRVARFNLNAYSDQNFVNFEMLDFQVPISLNGWTISGNIPLDLVSVEYRFSETEPFKDLPQETSISPSSTVQFRIVVQLDPRKFVQPWTISKLKVYGVQV